MLKLTIWCAVLFVTATITHVIADNNDGLRKTTLERIDNVIWRTQDRLNDIKEGKFKVEFDVNKELTSWRNDVDGINQKLAASIHKYYNASNPDNTMICMPFHDERARVGRLFIDDMEKCAKNMLNNSFQSDVMANYSTVLLTIVNIRKEAEACDSKINVNECYDNASTAADKEYRKFIHSSSVWAVASHFYDLVEKILNTCRCAHDFIDVRKIVQSLENVTTECIESKRDPTFMERASLRVFNFFNSICENRGPLSFIFCNRMAGAIASR